MNIDAVRTLLLAVDLGSLSAAGAHLGVPPSTVSRRVNDLEADLDQQLLVRTGRGVRPTEDAAATLAQLREVLVAIDACYRPAPDLTHLRVTAPSEMAISLLPELLPQFAQANPKVHVEVHGSDRVVGLVEQSFDLAIRAGSLADSSYLARPLRAAALVAVAVPSMVESIHSLDDLARAPTVLVGLLFDSVSGRWNGDPFTVQPPALARVDSFTAAMPLVCAGLAWLATPTHLARGLVASGRLAVLKEVQFEGATLHALYPRRHRKQAALHSFIDLVAEALGRGLP